MIDLERAKDIVYSATKGVDEITTNECNQHTVGVCIAMVMMAMGYGEVDAYAASLLTSAALDDKFATAFWRGHTQFDRVATLMSAVEAAITNINEGLIDEDIRHRTAEALAQEKSKYRRG